ncbi:ESX secretion-associated protein EspG [Kibdelosporangium persicum]|uniref:ESX secretion-associated protein EspG n=1 Tax=Kibdelosporangium persicum TaxID=2698649 RepID=A0ABX2FFA6_9PSEU|nr:ESX secretion-associated protein EspG [Kibdelosporangium persicum]NRN69511.1 hypothetical protein [Kibdelosporangium persicum]
MTSAWPLRLSGSAFVVLWEKLGLGTLPRALFAPSPGATAGERSRVERAAAEELTRLGIGRGHDIDHELVVALRLLAMPAAEYYGWVVPAGGPVFGVQAAAAGNAAVLSTVADSMVELIRVNAGNLASAVGHRLPPHPPARSRPVTTEHTRQDFERAVGDAITGNGQFFVAVRDKLGRRRQYEQAIEYVDTARGRWLLRRGNGTTTAVPADAGVVGAELDRIRWRLVR